MSTRVNLFGTSPKESLENREDLSGLDGLARRVEEAALPQWAFEDLLTFGQEGIPSHTPPRTRGGSRAPSEWQPAFDQIGSVTPPRKSVTVERDLAPGLADLARRVEAAACSQDGFDLETLAQVGTPRHIPMRTPVRTPVRTPEKSSDRPTISSDSLREWVRDLQIPPFGTSGKEFIPSFRPNNGVCQTPKRGQREFRDYPSHPFVREALKYQSIGIVWIPSKETSNPIPLEVLNTATNTGGQFNVVAKIRSADYDSRISDEFAIVKMPRDFCIMTTDHILKLPETTSEYVLRQYSVLLDAYQGCPSDVLPIAQILNPEDVQKGCGFYVMEYIPHEFKLPWNKKASLEDIRQNPEQIDSLEQIKRLLETAWKRKIEIDLKPDNLRIRKDRKTIALIDYREKPEGTGDMESLILTAVAQFTTDPQVKEFLISGIEMKMHRFAGLK